MLPGLASDIILPCANLPLIHQATLEKPYAELSKIQDFEQAYTDKTMPACLERVKTKMQDVRVKDFIER